MATYRELHGKAVKTVTTNPSDDAAEGQIWFNSTDNTFKSVVSSAAWSSTSPFPAAYMSTGTGPQTASCFWGGAPPSPSGRTDTVEYNGFGFSTGGALNDAVFQASGYGTQTAAVDAFGRAGGSNKSTCEEYNGTSWTTGNSVNTGRYNASGTGTLTAGLTFGGTGTPNYHNATESYDGTNFSNAPTLNTKRGYSAGFGTQTAACMAFGLIDPGGVNNSVEEYDGSSWTTVTNYPVSVGYGAGAGTQTSGVAWSFSPPQNITCTYDGTSWTVTGATAATNGSNIHYGNMGTQTAAMAAGRPSSNAAEELNISTNVITPATWSSGTNMPEGNYGAASFGTQTAFVYFGGAPYPALTNATREYNGSAWSTTGNYIGSIKYLSGAGVESAGLGAGGQIPSPGAQNSSAEYDGSSWTSGNTMSNNRMNTGSTMVGTQPAALIVGGDQFPSTPRSLTACEEYDGTNWTSGGAYPIVIQNTAAAGTESAGWAAGGQSDPAPGVSNITRDATNEYNGSSWTAGSAIPTATMRAGAAGPQAAGLFFSGQTPGSTGVTTTVGYDGTSWSTRPSMATGRQSLGAGGVSSPATAAIGAGGYVTPGVTAATEEFNGETTSLNVKTLTQS